MDDAWRVKCSSALTSPPPSGPPLPPLPPPQLQPPTSVNQMDVNPRLFSHPFSVQEPLAFQSLSSNFAKMGETELSNSFLALLSGHPQTHSLLRELSQLPSIRSAGGGAGAAAAAAAAAAVAKDQIPSIPIFSGNSTSSNTREVPAFIKPLVPSSRKDQTFQGLNAAQSMSCNRPEKMVQQRMQREVSSAVAAHDSARSSRRPRVMCMNTVGELFLSELGLLGVLCFCHKSRMSVAKFCEHSGSAGNPGEAVRLENGVTIAQWRKQCFGNHAPDDGKGWDWSEGPTSKNGFVRSREGSFPILSQNSVSAAFQTFAGIGKSGDNPNGPIFGKPPGMGAGPAAVVHLTNKVEDRLYQRNKLERPNHSTMSFFRASQSDIPSLAKNQMVYPVRTSPDYLMPQASSSIINKGEQNVWCHLVTNNDNFKGKSAMPSVFYPYSDAKDSSSWECSSSRKSLASDALIAAREGSSSNIDLRLGQPSQIHTSLSSVPTALNPLQFVICHPQKLQTNLLPPEKNDYPLETKKPRIGLGCTAFEAPAANRGLAQQAVGFSNSSAPTGSKELAGIATKNSSISSFLSHLNTERSNISQLSNAVESKISVLDLVSSKFNIPEHISDANGLPERKKFLGPDSSNTMDKTNQLRHFDNVTSSISKANYQVQSKQAASTRVLMPASDGPWLHHLQFSKPPTFLQSGFDSKNSHGYGRVPSIGNRDNCNRAIDSSTIPVSYASSIPQLSNSVSPTDSSLNSRHISEPTAVTHSRNTGHSQHLVDDNVRLLALRQIGELSRQEKSIASIKVSSRQQRQCCHLGTELRRTLCCGDPAGTEELRQGTCCVIQQNVPKATGRSDQPCSNCCSANCAGILAAEWGKRDAIGHCKCRSFSQRVSQCSVKQDIPSCCCCGADKHSCSRLGRIPDCTSATVVFDENAQTTSFSRGCCCSNVLLKHVSGCCLSGGFSPSGSCNKQSICGNTRTNFFTKPCYEDHAFQDRGSTCLCECTKKHFVVKNDVQAGLWRDVPAKKIGHSDATSCDNPAQELKNSSEKGDQLPGIAPDSQVLESVNEQQMSNACSGSSAPAVTEVSVEVNKAGCCTTNANDYETVYNFGAGEGSGVEKCGSSDEAPVIREGEGALVANSIADPTKSGNFLPGHSPGDPIDERRLDISSNKKTVGNQLNIQYEAQENVKKMQVSHLKADKRKGQLKVSELDKLVPKSGFRPPNSESSHCVSYLRREYSLADGSKLTSQYKTGMQKSNLKRKRSSLSSTEPISQKRNSPHNIFESDKIKSVDNNQSLRAFDSSEKEPLSIDRRKQFAEEEGYHMDSDKPPKYMSLSCIAKSNDKGAKIDEKNARPVVCGKTGIILCGGSQKKPVKIVSLNSILERSKRCDINESEAKPQQPVISQNRKMTLGSTNNGFCNSSELQHKHENASDGFCKSSELQHRHENFSDCKRKGTDLTSFIASDANEERISRSGQIDEISMTGKETDDESNREEELALHHKYRNCQTRPRYREVRECSLSELLRKDKCENKLPYAPTLGATSSSTINATDQTKPHSLGANGNSFIDTSSGGKCLDDEDPVCELDQMDTRSGKVRKCQPFVLNSDVICCVCGSSDKADSNSILQCKCCFIKVHQACYGISKVPRGPWHCRPCKTNSRKTVCVLCGYEGGAMTRAVKTHNVVKSLLKAWNFGTGTYFMKSASCSEIAKALEPNFAIEAFNSDIPCSVSGVRSASSKAFSECPANLPPQNQTSTASFLGSLPKEMQQNSVIAGVLDPSVVQWVHMVCSLWTPGTRCLNVDTMSAFDVSGASAARKNTVCSMCNRPGGCCIRCRVRKCSVHFHPWCAHQKGLLQSEVEGDDNENVGFYGRCMLHAAQNDTHDGTTTMDVEVESPRKEWSCARIEIFKGRKRDKGFKPDRRSSYCDSGGCIVSQEQINAWLHINGQRSCTRAVVKFHSSDVEHDCRKEYFRYKQSKAWKHLVVYKSGIHALGLYTSQLIFRGAMVVEYVGEIVGPRVADKREIEYQSGKRLQYKSACYFFRIDKEHIIDATRKGGIARFVNHSCTPNCVAKIISVRNEKKVVFFAERDINPGEEITYDYHFNCEDEGQKIPCYCNSKNCRLYLN